MSGRSRIWIGRLFLVAIGLSFGWAVAEVGLWLLRPQAPRLQALLYSPTFRTEYDGAVTLPELLRRSTLGYHPLGHTPGFVLNSRGFRTDEYSLDKAQGTFRVLALGDSFTFDSSGVPIAAMWHQVFERDLAERLGRPVEVLSLSAPGVGPRFALRLWELEGRRLNADLVVLAFFVGNDFTDEAGVPLEASLEGGLARRSLAFRLLRNAWRLRRAVDASAAAPSGQAPQGPASESGDRGGFEIASYPASYDPQRATFTEEHFLRIELDRLRVFAGWEMARFEPLVCQASQVVERLARGVEASGAAFVLLIVPDEAQVDPSLLLRLRTMDGPTEFDVDRPQRLLAEALAHRRVTVLDLLATFRERHSSAPLYRPRDTHWSPEGNRAAGRTLAEFVAERERNRG